MTPSTPHEVLERAREALERLKQRLEPWPSDATDAALMVPVNDLQLILSLLVGEGGSDSTNIAARACGDAAGETSCQSEALTRSRLAKIALAAWCNVDPDQLPPEKMWIEHPSDANRQAWERVVLAIQRAVQDGTSEQPARPREDQNLLSKETDQ